MYAHHATVLGTTLGVEPAQPSLWDNFLKQVTGAVSAGFNIYDKAQELQRAQKARQLAEEQARQLAEVRRMQALMAQQQPQQTGFDMSEMAIPALGVGAVLVIGYFMTR